MYIDKFNIENLDYKMCASFTKCRYEELTEEMYVLMQKAEAEILKVSSPKAVYQIFDIEEIGNGQVSLKGTDFKLIGNSICRHLENSEKVILLAVTLGADTDRIIKRSQITDLAYACFLDGMAGVMVETVCDRTEDIIRININSSMYEDNCEVSDEIKSSDANIKFTYRYGLGYGDLPISLEHEFLRLLNANTLIGLNSTESYLLTPCKSVACVIGVTLER